MEVVESAVSFEDAQLVTFKIGDEDFGLGISNVKEIIEVPPITGVPNTPDYFKGVINLRGEILSVVSIRKRFDIETKENDEFTRIIITSIKGYKIGIVVDSVSEVLSIGDESVQPPPSILKGDKDRFIRGVIELAESNRIILLLDIDELVNEGDFKVTDSLGGGDQADHDAAAEAVEKQKTVEEEQMVTFRLGKENYGIVIHEVVEILNKPEVTPVPQVSEFIEGVIPLRGKIIPLVNMGVRFNIRSDMGHKDASVIIVNISGIEVGLTVDDISEVLRVPKDDVAPPPPHLTQEEADQLHGVIKVKTEEKMKLILYLDLANVFTEEMTDILQEMVQDENVDSEEEQHVVEDKTITLVSFETGKDLFGINIENVKEITTVPEITAVPKAPPFVEGIVNLRGEVITVVNLRTRFGFERIERNEFNRIIIVKIDNNTTGLLVDQVQSVTKISESSIEPRPKIISGIRTEFIDGVVRSEDGKRMLIMVNLQKLLSEKEKEELKGLAPRGGNKQEEKELAPV